MSQSNFLASESGRERTTIRRVGAVGSATVLAGGSAFGVLAALAGPSGAATFTVTEATDDGTGTVANTLSWAIEQANADPDADVVDFAPGLSTITFSDSAEQVPITETVSITGPGSDELTIDFADNCGLLFDAETASLTVSGLTLRNGSVGDGTCSGRGSDSGGALAVYSDFGGPGTSLIDDVVFDANYAYYYGGGLAVSGGASVTIQDSAFTNNGVYYGVGGGAYIENSFGLNILRTTFTGNTAPDGGALEVSIPTGSTARIVDSTFTDNQALDGNGGAIAIDNGSAELVNSSLSGNSSTGRGGGFWSDVPVKVIQSTITGNYAGVSGGGAHIRQGVLGGGADAAFEIVMSTISGNVAGGSGSELFIDRINNQPRSSSIVGSIVAGSGSGVSVFGAGSTPATDFPVNVSDSLIGTATDVPWVDGGGNTFDVADPGLEALADNGGPTETMALSAGSPAIDAGPDPVPSFPENSYDQRGEPYARVYGASVDIGAFEAQPEPEPSTTTTTTIPEPTTTSTNPAPTSSVPDPTTPTTSDGGSESASGGLPATGASVAPLVAAGAALVASGGAASLLALRRRRSDGQPGHGMADDEA